jgi:flagellar protein FlbT
MLMNPDGAGEAREMFRKSLAALLASFRNEQVLAALKDIDRLVGEDHVYEALRAIRTLYRAEEEILAARPPVAHPPAVYIPERKAS